MGTYRVYTAACALLLPRANHMQPSVKGFMSALAYVILCYMTLMADTVASLECFACHDLKTMYKCRTTTICGAGQVCMVQKVYSSFKDEAGESHLSIYYNMVCKERSKCVNNYSSSTKFNVHSRYISSCCCTNRCLEEDGTGYGDYSNCYNALTYEEALRRSHSSLKRSEINCFMLVLGVLLACLMSRRNCKPI